MNEAVFPIDAAPISEPDERRRAPTTLVPAPRPTPIAERDESARVETLLGQLTRDEKLALLSGQPGGPGVIVPGVPRLGIPSLRFADGPAGLDRPGATAYPAPIALAATWDPELAAQYGSALGTEARAHGVNALFGPMVNILRVYHSGRAPETLGEDPCLTSAIAVPLIEGIQDKHVLSVVKHFGLYSQETDRFHISAEVGDRALHEIYLPAFDAAVGAAGAGAVMAAHNKVAGTYSSEHAGLLQDELRDRFGFTGFVVSDWEGTHSLSAITAGLSVELPFARYFGAQLRAAVDAGEIDITIVDDHCRRILRSMVDVGLLDHPVRLPAWSPQGPPDPPPECAPTAGAIAERGIVLLKNDRSTLPIEPGSVRRVAVIGAKPDGVPYDIAGSAWVRGREWCSPVCGLREALGGDVEIEPVVAQPVPFMDARPTLDALSLTPPDGVDGSDLPGGHGLLAEYFANPDLAGEPALRGVTDRAVGDWHAAPPDPSLPERYSVRFTAWLTVPATGRYTLGVEGFGRCKLFLDEVPVADGVIGPETLSVGSGEVTLETGIRYLLRIEYQHYRGWTGGVRAFWEPPSRVRHPDVERAATAAASADAAVVIVGTFQTEGYDRPSLGLPGAQDALVEAVVAANPRTVVVLMTGGPVLMPWIDRVPAVLAAWYGGERIGEALGRVLSGAVDPSGRLPVSFPKSSREIPTQDTRRFPGTGGKVEYSEDLLVGYRWYDATGNASLFPFGHGLSYTTFDWSDHHVGDHPVTPEDPLDLSVTVTNTGTRPGWDVVQVYVGSGNAFDGPPRRLRAFAPVALKPGESRVVRFELTYRDFCQWSTSAADWVVAPGQHRVFVGRSSADLPWRENVEVESGSGPCSVTLDTPSDVSMGSVYTVSATVANLGTGPVSDLGLDLRVPADWDPPDVTSAPDPVLPGGGTATASWLVRPPVYGRTGTSELRVATRYSAGGEPRRAWSGATLTTSYQRLAASFDCVGIGDEDGPDSVDFCGMGCGYLRPALARAGLLPGRTVTCGDLYFTWPNVEPGSPDNTIANGQRVPISCTGRQLAFLGAGTGGAVTGVGTVFYADGSQHRYAVTLPDWLANQPLPDTRVVATVEQYQRGRVWTRRSVSLYAASIPVFANRAVTAFTLPVVERTSAAVPRMHVFGVSIC